MRKILLMMIMLLFGMITYAQTNVNARMWGVFFGSPKQVVVETTGEKVNFDRDGRVTSYSMGDNEIRYSWNGSKITLAYYQNGEKLGEEYVTVKNNSATEIYLTNVGGYVKETYNAAGLETESVISGNGQSLVEKVYYRDDTKYTPYKITMSMGGQTEELSISNVICDSKGNWNRMTATSNGQTQTDIRSITYY